MSTTGSKQDVAEEAEDMLCYADFMVRLWVPSSPSSATLYTHVCKSGASRCQDQPARVEEDGESKGEIAQLVLGSWSRINHSVQDVADEDKEADDECKGATMLDEIEAVSAHDGCAAEFHRSLLSGFTWFPAQTWQKLSFCT